MSSRSWRWRPGGDSHVRSNGFAARLRPGRARLLPAALDGYRTDPGAEGPGNQPEGYRAGRAELADQGDPDRQLLWQSVRNPGAVLCPDRAGAAAAQGRSVHRAAVLGLR